MRPLFHPSIDDISVEGILHALSDPVRVQIYGGIVAAECSKICSNFRFMENRTLPKSTLSQHFKVLREAGLIRSERKGVEMHNTPRCQDLKPPMREMVSAIMCAYQERAKAAKPVKATKAARPAAVV